MQHRSDGAPHCGFFGTPRGLGRATATTSAAFWLHCEQRIRCAGGDDDPHDNRLATFDLPYPNLSYLTDAAIFSPRNLHDIQPFVSINPTRELTLTAGTQFLWRNSRHDSVYSAAYFPVVPPGGRGLYVTTEPYVRVNWRIVPLVEFQGGIGSSIYVRRI